jgi:hypothetical protein
VHAKGPGIRSNLFNWPGYRAAWHQGEGVPGAEKSNHGLHLEKVDANAEDRAFGGAGAPFWGEEGTTLSELGFDVRTTAGQTCSLNAPRYEVNVEDGTSDGALYVFGCASGVHTPIADGWQRVRFGDADAVRLCREGETDCNALLPLPAQTVFGSTVRNITIRFQLPQGPAGVTHLDNLDINGTLLGTQNG